MALSPIPKNTSALAGVFMALPVSWSRAKNDLSTCPLSLDLLVPPGFWVPIVQKVNPPGGKTFLSVAILRIEVTGTPIEP